MSLIQFFLFSQKFAAVAKKWTKSAGTCYEIFSLKEKEAFLQKLDPRQLHHAGAL